MSWLSAAPLVLLAAAWVTLPGLLAGVAVGLRGTVAWGAAPLLSIGLIAGSAVVGGRFGIPWSGAVPVAAAMLVAVLVVGARRLVLRRRTGSFRVSAGAAARSAGTAPGAVARSAGAAPGAAGPPAAVLRAAVRVRLATLLSGGPDGRWTGLAATAGLLLAAALGFRTAIRGMDRPDALSQTFDANFHYNAVARILATGDASSLTVGELVNSPAPYPGAWHGVVSLVAPLAAGPGEVVVASNVVALVVTLLVWPLSALLLTRMLLGRSAGIAFATPVLATGFAAFPWTLVTYGALWPNLIGVALLPAALAAVAAAVRPGVGPAGHPGTFPAGRVARWAPAAAAVPTLGLAHPNALFGLVVLAAPVVVWGVAGAVRRGFHRGPRRAVAALAVVPVVAAAGAGLAWVMFAAPFLDGIRSYYWAPEVTRAGAIRNAVLHSPDGIDPAWSLAVLTVAGAVVALRRARTSWLVPAHLLVCTLYVIGASTWSSIWTGVWYNDAPRLAALVPVTAVPLSVIGLLALCALARRVACVARDALTRMVPAAGGWPRPRAAVLVATAVLGVVVVSGGLYQSTHIDRLADIYQNPEEVLVGPQQAEFLRAAGRLLPEDAVVAQNPWAGTAMLWAMTDREVLFPHLTGVWSADQQVIAERLHHAATDPAVCAAVAETGVGYALTAPPTFWNWDPLAGSFTGLTGLAEAPGFELLATDGENALYEITACDPEGTVDT